MTKRTSKPSQDQTGNAREQMKLRLFSPKQRSMLMQTLRYALQVSSVDKLPKVFQLPAAVALKPGSWDELAKRYNIPDEKTAARRTALESAKALYCRSDQYAHAVRNCEQLFSIDLDPAGAPARTEVQTGTDLSSDSKTATDRKNATPAKGRTPERTRRSPEKMRRFHPEQHAKLQARFCGVFGVTRDDLPALLKHPLATPLKIGADKDLVKRFNLPDDKTAPERRKLSTAIRRYVLSSQYHHAVLNCATRFTIDMDPDEAITDTDRNNAINWLRILAGGRTH